MNRNQNSTVIAFVRWRGLGLNIIVKYFSKKVRSIECIIQQPYSLAKRLLCSTTESTFVYEVLLHLLSRGHYTGNKHAISKGLNGEVDIVVG